MRYFLSLVGLLPMLWSFGEAACLGADGGLTPESLAMPRVRIALGDNSLRLFNGRGAICIRDRTVTGLQALNFPPAATTGYRFGLAFREQGSGTLIRDVADDVQESWIHKGGLNPLGLNRGKGPLVVLLQDATWRPNQFVRTGTFHKRLQGRWISFGLSTKASVSAEADEAYLEVEVENREDQLLDLTLCPEQKKGDPGDVAECIAYTLKASTMRHGMFQTTVVSDLGDPRDGGWPMQIPGRQKRTARFAIVAQPAGAKPPPLRADDLAARIERADTAIRRRLDWASDRLPRVTTENGRFDEFYRRCILSVLECRWDRENFAIHPFYAAGDATFSLACDTSYTSKTLAVLDPEGLKAALFAYIRAGLTKHSYVRWDGFGRRWYAFVPFGAMQIALDYLAQTGDTAFLDQSQSGVTVFESLKNAGLELHERFARPDGLLDFGEGSETMLENRTDGLEHVVAACNGLAADYFRQMALWCRQRNDPHAEQFDKWAAQIHKAMNEQLWNEKEGWFDNLYPDGSRHLFLSYYQFDLLSTPDLPPAQRQRMTEKIKEGQFLGPYGMYSVSRLDRTHWDLEDTDWGGGGQYVGAPLRISELLYRGGQPDLAWDVLSRCLRWVEKYPYFPQDVFTDSGDCPKAEMPLEISAGGGVQAILFGVFGLRPKADGALEITPAYHPSLGRASMKGYRFRGHVYDVVMNPAGFQVYRDGKPVADKTHGSTVTAAMPEQAVEPFNGKNLDGWNLRLRRNIEGGKWTVGTAKPREGNPAELDALPGGTELVNTGKALNIFTAAKFGDFHLEIEVLVPRGANSGIYLMGNYEIQVFDSYGKKDAGTGDMGAVYDKTAPRSNAALPPGQWQKFAIDFRAPRFDNEGRKVANARLVRCTLNGRSIHENVEIEGCTGAALSKQELPSGPLMLQGDHGPIAYRNIHIQELP